MCVYDVGARWRLFTCCHCQP